MGRIQAWRHDGGDPVLDEMGWERQMLTEGSELYDARLATADASDTSTGKATLRKYLKRAAEAIQAMQLDVLGRARVERDMKGTVALVPADTLALITLKTLIDCTCTVPSPDTGAPVISVSQNIGRSVATELNFRNWVTSSCEQARAYAEEKGIPTPRSFAEKLIAERGATRRNLNQWKKTFEELCEYEWDNLAEYFCGDALLQAVVDALPECFEIHHPIRKGKSSKCVRMLPEFLAAFNDKEARLAMIQPVRKPMLTEPHDWKRTP